MSQCRPRVDRRDWMPSAEHFDLDGLKMSKQQFEQLQSLNLDEMKAEMLGVEELFLKLVGDLPKEMVFQRGLLIARL